MLDADEALLLLGGDLGDVRRTLAEATRAIGREAGTLVAQSRDHWTEPWGFRGDGLFLNQGILLRTHLAPEVLLGVLQDIERRLGRERSLEPRYASRTVDIDILLFGSRTLGLPKLTLPHPRMHERRFALAPAADIAPLAIHPTLDRCVLDLLNDLRPPA